MESQVEKNTLINDAANNNNTTEPKFKWNTVLRSIVMFCLMVLPCVIVFTFFMNIVTVQMMNSGWPFSSSQKTTPTPMIKKILTGLLIVLTNSSYIYFEVMHRISDLESRAQKILSITVRLIIAIIALIVFNLIIDYKYYNSDFNLLILLGLLTMILYISIILALRIYAIKHENYNEKNEAIFVGIVYCSVTILLIITILLCSDFSNNIHNITQTVKSFSQEIYNYAA